MFADGLELNATLDATSSPSSLKWRDHKPPSLPRYSLREGATTKTDNRLPSLRFRIFLTTFTPCYSLATTLSFDHGGQVLGTEGTRGRRLSVERGHRSPESHKGNPKTRNQPMQAVVIVMTLGRVLSNARHLCSHPNRGSGGEIDCEWMSRSERQITGGVLYPPKMQYEVCPWNGMNGWDNKRRGSRWRRETNPVRRPARGGVNRSSQEPFGKNDAAP